jgi:acetyl esterase/lipase
VLGITRPRMVVFRPLKPNGSALLIAPGGGYSWVVLDKEGYELGPLFADRGITVFALFYRLSHEGWAAGPDVALSDAQRAMRLIRARASVYGRSRARRGDGQAGGRMADLFLAWAGTQDFFQP